MKLLLDTHTFLWFINGDAQLSSTARDLIQDPANTSFISAASLWEIAIKPQSREARSPTAIYYVYL